MQNDLGREVLWETEGERGYWDEKGGRGVREKRHQRRMNRGRSCAGWWVRKMRGESVTGREKERERAGTERIRFKRKRGEREENQGRNKRGVFF